MSTIKLANPMESPLLSVNDSFEMVYLQQRLGVTREQILSAIGAVGNGRREVIAYLERQKKNNPAILVPSDGFLVG